LEPILQLAESPSKASGRMARDCSGLLRTKNESLFQI
jgi:hypothetical protein